MWLGFRFQWLCLLVLRAWAIFQFSWCYGFGLNKLMVDRTSMFGDSSRQVGDMNVILLSS